MFPTLVDVERARARIAPYVRRTPLLPSEWLSERAGRDVFLKLESLQVTHSFKARGALNAALVLRERAGSGTRPRIVTASAGNHGRGLAWAARIAGLDLLVFTPRSAPRAKLEPIRAAGAELRAEADDYEASERAAKDYARANGIPFISAYSHPDLLAAIGTIALEILEDLPATRQIVAPVGGGGLVAGVAATAKATDASIEIVGVEAQSSQAFTASLKAGRIVEVEVAPTIADGLAGNMDPDNLAFPIVQTFVDRIALVSEDELRTGIRELLRHDHLVAEGAGIAGVAAVASGHVGGSGPTVIIISGANIDVEKLKAIL